MDTHANHKLQTAALQLPIRIYETQRKMDDYFADDMHYGDISEKVLRERYRLRDISTRINPFTFPNRLESARILFDEFRCLSTSLSFVGEYQSLIGKLIDHMQYGQGDRFFDPMLDAALENHSSMESSLQKIKQTFTQLTDWGHGHYPESNIKALTAEIAESKLPKFNSLMDRINGLAISVHDTWATHITLESYEVNRDRYKAKIHYRVQDHFGLDNDDISNLLYREFRIFRIWFTLQRWQGYGYQPFITEMNAIKTIEGSRFDTF